MEQPPRLARESSGKRCEEVYAWSSANREERLANVMGRVAEALGRGLSFESGALPEAVKADILCRGAQLSAKRKKMFQARLADRDERAEPVLARQPRHGTATNPIRKPRQGEKGLTHRVVEYEPDPDFGTSPSSRIGRKAGPRGI
ncbi:MAG: hypothetical protein OXN89_21915 [Bryobacterales bacterium]|nr:hypothetical protein [Bryobacterales bacterium]